MTPIRDAYLVAAAAAADLLEAPAVTEKWSEPSALTGFTVGGLAGHLAGQVLFVADTMARPVPEGQPVSLLEHYGRVKWIGADLDSEVNVAIRQGGDKTAADGPAALVARTRAAVAELTKRLAVAAPERLVSPPAGPWALRLDDFLITRLMEITVHSDDLAYSVGIPTPDLPPEVTEPVIKLLTSLSIRKYGHSAVLRALSRSERAPTTISAL